ncbi:MAG: hypothetical protein PsegKO_20840 [Pseudohongiellaceae bacterium]
MSQFKFKSEWVLEGALIVGSILLALAAEAWWSNLKEKRAGQELLELLRAQYHENLSAIEDQITRHEQKDDQARELLKISSGEIPWPGYEDVAALLQPLFLYDSYDSSSGAVTSFLTSENPGLIEDQQLKTYLASWPSLLEENSEDEQRIIDFIDNQFKPYIRSSIPFGDAFDLAGASSFFGSFNQTRSNPDILPMIKSLDFSNLMVERAMLERIVLRENRTLLEAGREILNLINNELDE